MDLLTVVAHELGHLLGQEHDKHGIMARTLAAGTRLFLEEQAAVTSYLGVHEDSLAWRRDHAVATQAIALAGKLRKP